MVEPNVPSTFGPRVGHEMLAIKTHRHVRPRLRVSIGLGDHCLPFGAGSMNAPCERMKVPLRTLRVGLEGLRGLSGPREAPHRAGTGQRCELRNVARVIRLSVGAPPDAGGRSAVTPAIGPQAAYASLGRSSPMYPCRATTAKGTQTVVRSGRTSERLRSDLTEHLKRFTVAPIVLGVADETRSDPRRVPVDSRPALYGQEVRR